MFSKTEVHCEYCQCPKKIWKPGFKTYQGYECKLYSDFIDVINEFEQNKRPFNNQDIYNKCKEFEKNFPDIPDFSATIEEMIQINIDEGYMPGNYKRLTICK